MPATHLMFFPVSGSKSVGAGPFSFETMLREGVPPHMVQSSLRALLAKSAKAQAAVRARGTVLAIRIGGLLPCASVGARVLTLVVSDQDVVVVDEAGERADQRVAEHSGRAVGVGRRVLHPQRPLGRLLTLARPDLALHERLAALLIHSQLQAIPLLWLPRVV